MSSPEPDRAPVIPLRPAQASAPPAPVAPPPATPPQSAGREPVVPGRRNGEPVPSGRRNREPLWRHVVGQVLRRERLGQERTLKEVADEARISMPYLSEIERGRKEPSSEVLAAAAHALGLSLADLLTLSQGELARLRAGRGRASSGHSGQVQMSLAA